MPSRKDETAVHQDRCTHVQCSEASLDFVKPRDGHGLEGKISVHQVSQGTVKEVETFVDNVAGHAAFASVTSAPAAPAVGDALRGPAGSRATITVCLA